MDKDQILVKFIDEEKVDSKTMDVLGKLLGCEYLGRWEYGQDIAVYQVPMIKEACERFKEFGKSRHGIAIGWIEPRDLEIEERWDKRDILKNLLTDINCASKEKYKKSIKKIKEYSQEILDQ